MMAGVIGHSPDNYTFHELSSLAAGADPKRFHKPTRDAIRRHREQTRGRGKRITTISSRDDKESFFDGLRSYFVKG